MFLASVDISVTSKITNKVFEMLSDIIEKIGEDNVVQVITDNVASYKA